MRPEHGADRFVDGREFSEAVVVAYGRQRDSVVRRQFHERFAAHGPLEMQMQVRLGKRSQVAASAHGLPPRASGA